MPVTIRALSPTEVTPGVTMMFLTDPDGRTVELVEFASGASTNYANLDATFARQESELLEDELRQTTERLAIRRLIAL